MQPPGALPLHVFIDWSNIHIGATKKHGTKIRQFASLAECVPACHRT